MTKIKITCEIDVDFQKFFDEIPEGLFAEDGFKDGKVDDWYMLEGVHKVIRDNYSAALMNHMNWMSKKGMKEHYEMAKHHLKIDEEIAKQISENSKVEIIKEGE